MVSMTHVDLFSGIGGFAYAVDQVWDDVEHIFCDNDKFCQQVLKKHWPGSLIYGDIRSITADTHSGDDNRGTKSRKGRSRGIRLSDKKINLLTGGFPCQPFSNAGLRRGTSDDRYLWPEMLRVIRLTKPQWVIAENVNGLLTLLEGVVFEQVCADLEAAGYEVQPFVIPAVAVNAPHRRDRIWFVANRNDRQWSRENSTVLQKQNRQTPDRPTRQNNHAQDSLSQRNRGRNEDGRQVLERQATEVQDQRPSWQSDWLEVATELCSVDDGLPVELDGFKLSKPQHRKEQLKAYGNAIVPQVAVEILKAISQTTK